MDKREIIGDRLVCLVLFVWAGASVLLNTTIHDFLIWNKQEVNSYVDYSVLILLVINIIFFQRYTIKDFVVIATGTLLVGYSVIMANHHALMAAWIFIVASKHCEFSKIIRLVYISQLIAFACVLYLFFSGYIEDYVIHRGSVIRLSLGFSHPNQLGLTVFLLGAYRIYGRRNKAGAVDVLLLVLLAYFVKTVPNSKTSYYSLLILAAIVLIHILIERLGFNFDSASNIFIFVAVFSNVFSIFMSLVNVKSIPVLQKIDMLMSNRFSMCYKTYRYYGMKWLGQDVQLFVRKVALGKYYHFWLDNAYMALLLRYGIIVYLAFSTVYIATMIVQKKKKNYLAVELMCLYAIYGIMENNFFSISQNLFLLLLGSFLFQENNKNILPEKSIDAA